MGSVLSGIKSYSYVYMCAFDRIHCRTAHGCAIDFSVDAYDTSLSFNDCWVENAVQAYEFKSSTYCTMTSCGADYVNYSEANGSPYGSAARSGDSATHKAVYTFNSSQFTLNSIAAENFYANGIIYGNGGNTTLTINSPICSGGHSDYQGSASYPNWCSAPIVTGTEGGAFNITAARSFDFTPTTPKRTASVFGYNYSDANGIPATPRVFLGPTLNTGTLINGQSTTSVDRDCVSVSDQSVAAITNGTIDGATLGATDPIPSAKFETIKPTAGQSIEQYEISGSGTVITIPHTSNGSSNRPHLVELSIISNQYNGNGIGGTCSATYRTLTSISSFSQLSATGHISSIASSGLNLQITLSTTIVNPLIVIKITGNNFVELENSTVA